MQQTQGSSRAAIEEFLFNAFRDRHIKATGAFNALTQDAEQLLVLCEQYPNNEPIHILKENVQAHLDQLLRASRDRSKCRTVFHRSWGH